MHILYSKKEFIPLSMAGLALKISLPEFHIPYMMPQMTEWQPQVLQL